MCNNSVRMREPAKKERKFLLSIVLFLFSIVPEMQHEHIFAE